MARLESRLKQQDIQLNVGDDTLNYLAEVGFDPVYGARPLKRVIEQRLINPLAQELLSGRIPPHAKVETILKDHNISFKITK